MSAIAFTKMHSAGNDFVVIDRRQNPVALPAAWLRAVADRRRGVGCDQVILIEEADGGPGGGAGSGAEVRFRFHNADGGEVGACGNGTRCVADKLMRETGAGTLIIATAAGILAAEQTQAGDVRVNMGPAQTDWAAIPLASEADTLCLDVAAGPLEGPVAVGIGNPHCVFFVKDATAVDLEALGPGIETHAMFPERTNVEVVSSAGNGALRMRVWERGVGITPACGSGACAVVVAARRRGLVEAGPVGIRADGGDLLAEWREDGDVLLSGPVATSFEGILTQDGNPA